MGNGIIGKILYFWMFMIGGIVVLAITGNLNDNKTVIILLVALALVYIVWNVFRELGKKKKAEKAAAFKQPVKKGTAKKKKRR